MGAFFGDRSIPKNTVVDPRYSLKISWLYYTTSGDDLLQYYAFQYKEASVREWTDPSVKSIRIPKEVTEYYLQPYEWDLNKKYTWRITAWLIDKDYDPDNPVVGVTGDIFMGAEARQIVDTSGWSIEGEFDSTTTTGTFTYPDDLDPGDYEMRTMVRNGFQWSAWSSTVPVVLYASRKYVKRSGLLWAVPNYQKVSGTFVAVNS